MADTEKMFKLFLHDSLDDFRQSWHEAMTGETIPVAELWSGLDDE